MYICTVYTYDICLYYITNKYHIEREIVSRDEGTRTMGWTLDDAVVFERDR
jgi:hypothetical protein